MQKIRVAIAMSGGVSLGAFSGGVLSEVVRILNEYNENNNDSSIEIDILAGGSAGNMNLGLVLRDLCANKTARDIEYNQRRAWVEYIDIAGLKYERKDMKSMRSLFNRRFVDEIATRLMEWNDTDSFDFSSLLASTVWFYSALTSLNGFGLDIRNNFPGTSLKGKAALGDALRSPVYKDMRLIEISRNKNENKNNSLALSRKDFDDDKKFWEMLAGTCVASGAFPIAFEPVNLKRYKSEYPADYWKWRDENKIFTYGDGGIFNNEPIWEALKLCVSRDRDSLDFTKRYIIFIDSKINESGTKFLLDSYKNSDVLQSLINNGTDILMPIMKQNQIKPWVEDSRYKELEEILNSSISGDLRNKYNIIGIGPYSDSDDPETEIDLYGRYGFCFSGFLKKDYREYDFNMGITAASKYLTGLDEFGGDIDKRILIAEPESCNIRDEDITNLFEYINDVAKNTEAASTLVNISLAGIFIGPILAPFIGIFVFSVIKKLEDKTKKYLLKDVGIKNRNSFYSEIIIIPEYDKSKFEDISFHLENNNSFEAIGDNKYRANLNLDLCERFDGKRIIQVMDFFGGDIINYDQKGPFLNLGVTFKYQAPRPVPASTKYIKIYLLNLIENFSAYIDDFKKEKVKLSLNISLDLNNDTNKLKITSEKIRLVPWEFVKDFKFLT